MQTGLLPRASTHHTVEAGVHLFLEGEVYNREHLRERAGILHSSDCRRDTPAETLLRAFLRDGPQCIPHCRGEFALAVYEERPHRLHLFTDHLATKALYYRVDPDGLLFGSEKKSSLAASSSSSLDPVGLLQVFALSHNIGESTFVSQIKCLPPGSHLLFADGQIKIHPYWHLQFPAIPHSRPLAELREHWADLLTRATTTRVQGNRRLVLFLSGGLDSRAVEKVRARYTTHAQSKFDRARPLQPDLELRERLESYFSSCAFEPAVFDAARIRTTLKEQYEQGANHGRLLSTLATFAVGLPLFLRGRVTPPAWGHEAR